MCDTIHYLELRAQGHTKSSRFHSSLKRVKQLLENHATKPAINQPCEFSGEPRATFLVDFSPNKRWAASTHGDHTVRVTDILSGKCTHILTGHPRTPWCLAFNPASDDILASGCLGGEVRIWDLHGGGSEVLRNPNEGQVITSLVFSPSGDAVVFSTLNKVYFWAWTRSKPFALTQTKYEFERVRWLRFDPFGRYLYTGIANNHSGRRVSARPESVHSENAPERQERRDENETAMNRSRYNEVIRRIIDHQYAHGHQVPGPSQSYLDMSRPRSPVNEERLTMARQYARHVTALTSGPSSVHSMPGGTAPRSFYSNSRAGTWDTVVAPALTTRYQGLRSETLSTERNLPHSPPNSGSGTDSSVSVYGYGQERRSRWGRYRPAFFSLNSYDRSQDNSDLVLESNRSIQNNSSSDEDDDFNNRNATPNRSGRLNRDLAEDGASALPRSSPPTFHPFSVRQEVSLGDRLETDEFEILPVDQERGTENSLLQNNSSASSPFQEENNGNIEGTSSSQQESLRWDDLQSLWMRCCNNLNSSDEAGPSSQVLDGASSTQSESAISATREFPDVRTRRTIRPLAMGQNLDASRPGNIEPLLNSDPFMGHAERNVEFFNLPSNKSSANSVTGSQNLTTSPQDVPSQNPENTGDTVALQTSKAGCSGLQKNKLTSKHRNCLNVSTGRLSKSVHLNSGDDVKLKVSAQQAANSQGSDNIPTHNNNFRESLLLHHEETSNNQSTIRPFRFLDIFSQEDNIALSSLKRDHLQSKKCKQNEDKINNSISENEATSSASYSTELTHHGADNMDADHPVRNTNLKCMNNSNIDSKKKASASSSIKGSNKDEVLSMTPSFAGPSSCQAGMKRKHDKALESSLVCEYLPGSKVQRKTQNVNPEIDAIGSIRHKSNKTFPINPPIPKKEDVAMCYPSAVDSDFLVNHSTEHLSESNQSANWTGAIGSAREALSVQLETQSPQFSSGPLTSTSFNPSSSTALAGMTSETVSTGEETENVQDSNSTTHSLIPDNPRIVASSSNPMNLAFSYLDAVIPRTESYQETRENLAGSNSDVTSALTQALAAVHCSRPSVSRSGNSPRLGNNPFHSIESPAVASVPLSTPTSNSGSALTVSSQSAASSSVIVHSPRRALLQRLNGSNLSSAFTVCSTSGHHNVANTSAAYRTSSAIFSHASIPTSSSSSQFSEAHTVSSASYSRDQSQTNAISTLTERATTLSYPWLDFSFGRHRHSRSVTQGSLQTTRVPSEVGRAQDRLRQRSQDLRDNEGTTSGRNADSSPQSDIPLVERLESLSRISRSMGERLQNLSRIYGRRASQLSQLQHRISVLEETYNRRMRFLHREYMNRLSLSGPARRQISDRNRSLRRDILHRHAALLGRSRTRSVESESPSSTAAQTHRDRIRRAIFADRLGLRVRHGGLTTPAPPNPATRDLLNFGQPSSDSNLDEGRVSTPPWLEPIDLGLHHTSNSRSRLMGMSRLGSPSIPPAPAPGSLHLYDESNRSADQENSEHEQEEEDGITDALTGDRNQHLHPDYQHSILGDGFGRHDDPLHYMMNNTIAGTFWTRDEHALASNFIPQTHRIQRWSVLTDMVPDISDSSANVVVRNCKLHNDASCSLSRDGKLLAAFVPTHRGFPDKMVLGVFSLENGNFAQCLYTKSFGPNAISVSISPENSYVLVGTAAKRMFFFSANQMVGQVYKMVKQKAGESSMRHTTDLFYYPENRTGFCSVNSACWLPEVGIGLVFGTNKGDLVFSRPGSKRKIEREPYFWRSPRLRESTAQRGILDFFPRRRNLTGFAAASIRTENSSSSSSSSSTDNDLLANSSGSASSRSSSATQTTAVNDHRSAATQTRNEEEEEEEEEVAQVAFGD